MVGEGDEANTAAMRGGRLPRSEKATGQAPTVAAAGADGIDDGKGLGEGDGATPSSLRVHLKNCFNMDHPRDRTVYIKIYHSKKYIYKYYIIHRE